MLKQINMRMEAS